jgi:hypothetical protein
LTRNLQMSRATRYLFHFCECKEVMANVRNFGCEDICCIIGDREKLGPEVSEQTGELRQVVSSCPLTRL